MPPCSLTIPRGVLQTGRGKIARVYGIHFCVIRLLQRVTPVFFAFFSPWTIGYLKKRAGEVFVPSA